jgi:4-aminobutyrate aminotransferase
VKAEGSFIYDVEGRAYLDFGTGVAVTALGHSHPAVVAAVKEQVEKLVHVSVTTEHELNIRLCERLVELTPDGLDMCFLANSGAEAVEGAIKLARRVLGRTEIVGFSGGFHGRTYGALTLTTSKANYREGYGPLLPGVHHLPFPSPRAMGGDEAAMAAFEKGLEDMFARIDPRTVAAFVVEPVLGEGGYIVPPLAFLPRLRQVADTHGILLVADEVQTGLGRTGRTFAFQHTDTVPDVLLLAKALGSGFPISAIVARRDLMEAWPPAAHGSTFGGNPVSCAAALATLDVMEREDLAGRSGRLGAMVRERLQESIGDDAGVAEVRGLGMMLGVQFQASGRHSVAMDRQEAVRGACLERDLLVLSCGPENEVIRIIPALNIPDADLDRGLDIFEQAVAATR